MKIRSRLLAVASLLACGSLTLTGVAAAHPSYHHKYAAEAAVVKTGDAALVPLAFGCENSKLEPHNGFQIAPACVSTPAGELAGADDNPSLLITWAPDRIKPGDDITIKVSTRNLIRNEFPPAGQGGYYFESAVLQDGIVRGHFHVGCRTLQNTRSAPEPVRSATFKAVEDGGGGKDPDTVKVVLSGKDANGQAVFKKGDLVQCAAWAGDGSHRVPMMQFANQIPAFDTHVMRVIGGKKKW
jgi:hypothetical protein